MHAGLAQGESVVLSSSTIAATDEANWPGYFKEMGALALYAFADSRGGTGSDGAVLELNEGLDNRSGPVTVTVGAGCYNILVNGDFESSGGWLLHNAAYVTEPVTQGLQSLQTGVVPYGWSPELENDRRPRSSGDSWSSVPPADLEGFSLDLSFGVYSSGIQEVVLPEDSTIHLSYWFYPICELNDPGDVHYVILQDEFGVDHWIWGDTADTRAWGWREHDVSAHAGKTMTLYLGTYNDCDYYDSAMFYDGAVLEVCYGEEE